MKITQLPIDGVLLIEPQVFGDSRGWFYESYNEERYRAAGICETFVQDTLKVICWTSITNKYD